MKVITIHKLFQCGEIMCLLIVTIIGGSRGPNYVPLKESVNVSSFVEQLNIQATLIWPAVEALESAMSVVISVCMVRLGLQG